ncbi:MAG: HU family DNA-binding protein [Bacteroides sp.]|nr:HU family DNA-binding protein [Bacteroides sp.]
MNEKVTIQDLANLLFEKHGMSKKDAELFIKGMFDLVEEALATEKYVKIKGLGVFKLTEVDSRESIDVNTGERIEIQGHTKVSFTPDSALKELINKPFSHFETVVLNEGVQLEDTKVETDEIINEVVEPNVIEEAVITKVEEECNIPEEECNAPEEECITPVEETIVETVVPETEIVKEEEVVSELETPVPVICVATEDDNSLEEDNKVEDTETVDTPELPVLEETIQYEDVSEESVQEDTNAPDVVEEEPVVSQPVPDKTNRGLVLITILLILIIIGGAYWLFFRPADNGVKEELIEKESIEKIDTIVKEVVEAQPIDTVVVEKTATSEEKQPAVVKSEEKVASLSDTTAYVIVGTKTTHTLQNGETIIRVALKYYGAKNFWPYIAKHNEKTIKNANNVPVGTKLLIPELAPKK